MRTNFFDAISVTSVEKVHSALIAWMLSDNCEGLTLASKSVIINNIFKLSVPNYTNITAQTEYDGIDILITADDQHFIIENKLKSSQHSDQLARYQNIAKANKWNNLHCGYLTLIGESANSDGWEDITYKKLYDELKSITVEQNTDGEIIGEYVNSLERLTGEVSAFLKDHVNYPHRDVIFMNGTKRKSDKRMLTDYISKNQLETPFQKLLFTEIVNRMKTKEPELIAYIGETHGSVNLDIRLGECDATKRKQIYFDLSLQNGTFKIACTRSDYSKTSKNDETIKPWIDKFKEGDFFGDYKRVNEPKSHARVSRTKPWDKKFYMFPIDDIVARIESELEATRRIAGELLELDRKP